MRSSMIHTALRAGFALGVAVITTIPLSAATRDKLLLSIVPEDAATVGLVRLDEMRENPVARRLFQETDKAGMDGEAQRFLTDAGLKPSEDVDALLFAASPAVGEAEAEVLVAAEGRFAVDRLSEALISRGGIAKTASGKRYFIMPGEGDDKGAVAFYDARLTLAGSEKGVVDALAAMQKGGTGFTRQSGLAFELARIDPNASCWMLVDVPRSQRLQHGPNSPTTGAMSQDAFATAMKRVAVFAAWAKADAQKLTFQASAVSTDAETRELLADMLRGLTAAWRMAAQEKKPELVSVIRQFDVADKSGAVMIGGEIPLAMLEDFGKRAVTTNAK